MKSRIWFIALLLISTLANAQIPGKKGYIALSIGPSFPVGDFADKSPDNISAGRAENGYINSILNAGYRIGDHLGVCFTFLYCEYNIGEENSNDWWQVTGLNAGLQYTFFPDRKFEVDLKAKAGLIVSSYVLDSYANGDRLGTSFGLDLRSSVRYNIFRRWCLLAEGGYITANQKYGDGHKGKLQAVLTGLGFGFRF